jgi:hypothetical protein
MKINERNREGTDQKEKNRKRGKKNGRNGKRKKRNKEITTETKMCLDPENKFLKK